MIVKPDAISAKSRAQHDAVETLRDKIGPVDHAVVPKSGFIPGICVLL